MICTPPYSPRSELVVTTASSSIQTTTNTSRVKRSRQRPHCPCGHKIPVFGRVPFVLDGATCFASTGPDQLYCYLTMGPPFLWSASTATKDLSISSIPLTRRALLQSRWINFDCHTIGLVRPCCCGRRAVPPRLMLNSI